MAKMHWLDIVAITLLLIGGINWGLVGFFNYNLVTALLGVGFLSSAIFGIVGVASIYSIYSLTKVGRK